MSEHDLQEVPVEPADAGDRLQESVVGDVASVVSALTGLGGGLRYVATAHHERQSAAADRATLADEAEELRRMLAYERGGLPGLDAHDAGDYSPGFSVDDDYYGGFGVE